MPDAINYFNLDGEQDPFSTVDRAVLGVSPDYTPRGYDSVQDYLNHIIVVYEADVDYDQYNRDWAIEDLRFAAGDQWDPDVKRGRELAKRPCLTINVLPQFIGQVVGDRRINKTAIKVRPLKDGTAEVADVRSGLIKSIELFSRAERVYDATCEDQVTCGIGNFRVNLEYAADDVFEQDIILRHIPNPLAVVWDRMSIDPTGRDARHCFVTDTMPREVYEKNFPDYPCPTGFSDEARMAQGWFDAKTVRITEHWEMKSRPATIMLAQDGDVKDITGMSEAEWMHEAFIDPRTGKPVVRQTTRSYACMHLVTGFAVLSEAYELPLTRLPIIRAEGRVIRVGEDRVRFGLVRFAKDSQRLKNYYRSNFAEVLALQPKAQWIADSASVEGREKEFREAHMSGDPLLIYNTKGEKPDRVDPPDLPAAYVQAEQMFQQDIKDTTGLHDASLGIRSNEVSGKAINARKVEGDVATVIYHDNLNHAILEGGDVINQLIPVAFDTIRTMRVIGDDDKHNLMVLNDPNDENSPDITKGKYDVTLTTGPSFTTQRQEALEGMTTLLQTAPEMMMVFGDEVALASDWPRAVQIAERIKRFIAQNNPAVLGPEDMPAQEQKQPTPEEQQAMAEQEAVKQAQLQEAAAQLEHAEQLRQAELQEQAAKVRKAEADAVIAEENARKAKFEADAAQSRAEVAGIEAEVAPIAKEQDLRHKEDQHEQGMFHAEETHGREMDHSEDAHTQKMDHAERAASDKSDMMKQRSENTPQKQPKPKGKPNA